ncbi:MAG: TylF/MycF/NovP-related O-methyltransferase [Vicinamibacterales bacterium]
MAGIVRRGPFTPIAAPSLHATQFVLGLTNREVVSFAQPHRAAAAARIREIVTGFPTQTMGVDEAYMIRAAVLATGRLPGAIAEVGVFRGGTARVIGEAKGPRPLHLFDTFQGLPAPAEVDQGFAEGEYACGLDAVRAFLGGIPDVHFHQGLFPATGEAVRDLTFSFVHLDVDLYQSTRDALAFFYPRMSVGGMLISHDYVEFPAVRQAFDDYFGASAQPVLELTGNQCLVVKVGG